jgi:hypothetical protein
VYAKHFWRKGVRTDQRWDAGVEASSGQPGSSAKARHSLAVVKPREIRVSLGVRLGATQDGGVSQPEERAAQVHMIDHRRKTHKSTVKTPSLHGNIQGVTSSTVHDISFELAIHEFQRTFNVLSDLRAPNLVLGLQLFDGEASLQFGTTRVFTVRDGTTVETETKERRL